MDYQRNTRTTFGADIMDTAQDETACDTPRHQMLT